MNQTEIITGRQLREEIDRAIGENCSATLSHLAGGKWKYTEVLLASTTEDAIHLELPEQISDSGSLFTVEQPVGLAFKYDYYKIVLQSTIVGLDSEVNQGGGGHLMIDFPKNAEKLQRRAYVRVPVPGNIQVKVLFWHRGYDEPAHQAPMDDYWQGKLVNISAGGMRIVVDKEGKTNYELHQAVGIQFTPLPYEQPILLEGRILHINDSEDGRKGYIGVQFTGLEASDEGRAKTRRLISVVNEYSSCLEKQDCEMLYSQGARED